MVATATMRDQVTTQEQHAVSVMQLVNQQACGANSVTLMLPSQSADTRNWSGWLMVIIAWTPVE